MARQSSAAAPLWRSSPPAPAPVPDQMPFDIPYGKSINREGLAIAAAITEASKSPRNWKLSVVVVDPNGEIVALHEMNQTQVASVAVSYRQGPHDDAFPPAVRGVRRT